MTEEASTPAADAAADVSTITDPSILIAVVLQTPGLNGRRGLPTIFWGDPGVAKTGKVRGVCRQLKRRCETVIASCREPQDFVGLPKNTDDGMIMVPPAYARRAAKALTAVIFYDEGSSAPPAVQSAMLRVVNEGVIGDEELPEGVSFILAANPPESAAGGWDLAAPMANRLVHLKVSCPTVEQWSKWLMGGDASVPAVPILDEAEWENSWRKARSLAAGYMQRNRNHLHVMPKTDVARGLAWPSPRSWEFGLRGYASGLAIGNMEVAQDLLIGSIGAAVGLTFLHWVKETDLPDPRVLLRSPQLLDLDKYQLDRAMAVLSSVVAEATEGLLPPGLDRAGYVEAAYDVLNTSLAVISKDITSLASTQLLSWLETHRKENMFRFGDNELKLLTAVQNMVAVGGGSAEKRGGA